MECVPLPTLAARDDPVDANTEVLPDPYVPELLPTRGRLGILDPQYQAVDKKAAGRMRRL